MQKIFKVSLISFFLILSSCTQEEVSITVEQTSSGVIEEVTEETTEEEITKDPNLIWEGKTMNQVKKCEDDGINCVYMLVDKQGEEIVCPDEVDCSFEVNVSYWTLGGIFSPDENYKIYFHSPNGKDLYLKSYSFETGGIESLMSFYPGTEVNIESWSPDGKKLALVGLQTGETRSSDYIYDSKLFILSIEDGKLIKKDKYNINMAYKCPNGCWIPDNSFKWLSDDQVSYLDYQWTVEVYGGGKEDIRENYTKTLNL